LQCCGTVTIFHGFVLEFVNNLWGLGTELGFSSRPAIPVELFMSYWYLVRNTILHHPKRSDKKETEINPIVKRGILCRLLTDPFIFPPFFVPCSMKPSLGRKT
jgi:hypothetical protein